MRSNLTPSLTAALEQFGIELLLCGAPPNVRYVTGYHNWMDPIALEYMARPGASARPQPVFAAATRGGRTGLAVQSIFVPNIHPGSVDVIAPIGMFLYGDDSIARLDDLTGGEVLPASDDARDALRKLMDALAGSPAEVALDSALLSPGQIAIAEQAVAPAAIRDATATLLLARAVKSDDEIAALRLTADIAARAISVAIEVARPGDSVSLMRRNFREAIGRDDADFDHLAFGVSGFGIAMDVEHRLENGSTLYVDYGAVRDGYFSDSGLTLCVGAPSDEASRAVEAAHTTIQLGASMLSAGTLSSEVRLEMQRTITELGYAESFPHGHGIGLQLRDYPILVEPSGLPIADDYCHQSSDLPLAVGNVVNLELAIFDPGFGSVQIERTYVVEGRAEPARPLLDQIREDPATI